MISKKTLFLLLSFFIALGGCQLNRDIELSPSAEVVKEMQELGVDTLALNPADDAHYAFILESLERIAENHPSEESLRAIEELNTAREMALNNELDLIPSPVSRADIPGLTLHDHLITTLVSDPVSNTMTAIALSTLHGGFTYGTLIVYINDPDTGQPISSIGSAVAGPPMTTVTASTTGTLPDGGAPSLVDVVSFEHVNINGIPYYSTKYAKGLVGKDTVNGGINWLIQEPAEHNTVDGNVLVCMDRYDRDCDYPVWGDRTTRVPFKGAVTTLAGFRIQSIDKSKTWIKMVGPINGGTIEMSLVDQGLGKFGDQIRIYDNPNYQSSTLTWDIPRRATLFLHPDFNLPQYYDYKKRVDWYIQITVMVLPPIPGMPAVPMVLSVSSLNPQYPYLSFKRSCIAEGSMVRMSDNSLMPVEKVRLGDLVNSGGADMRVVNISVGYEPIPMIRLVDEDAHTLLITKNHEVFTSKGMVMAGKLAVGDMVETEKGLKALVLVEQEMFVDKVYNLSLADPMGAESKPGHVYSANGFMIADGSLSK